VGWVNISVLVNAFAVLAGASFGRWIGKRIPDSYRSILFQVIALISILMGVKMGLESNDFLVVLCSLVLGGVIGQWVGIERMLGKLANRVEKSEGQTTFVRGFITATVLFVAGPMTILGCFQAGISGDNTLIFLKSFMDFISSIILASLYGSGVLLAAASVFVIQGTLVTFSGALNFLADPRFLNDFTGVGGVIMMAIGIRMMEIRDIQVGNLVPAMGVVVGVDGLLLWVQSFLG